MHSEEYFGKLGIHRVLGHVSGRWGTKWWRRIHRRVAPSGRRPSYSRNLIHCGRMWLLVEKLGILLDYLLLLSCIRHLSLGSFDGSEDMRNYESI
jgi:hypothetical protein